MRCIRLLLILRFFVWVSSSPVLYQRFTAPGCGDWTSTPFYFLQLSMWLSFVLPTRSLNMQRDISCQFHQWPNITVCRHLLPNRSSTRRSAVLRRSWQGNLKLWAVCSKRWMWWGRRTTNCYGEHSIILRAPSSSTDFPHRSKNADDSRNKETVGEGRILQDKIFETKRLLEDKSRSVCHQLVSVCWQQLFLGKWNLCHTSSPNWASNSASSRVITRKVSSNHRTSWQMFSRISGFIWSVWCSIIQLKWVLPYQIYANSAEYMALDFSDWRPYKRFCRAKICVGISSYHCWIWTPHGCWWKNRPTRKNWQGTPLVPQRLLSGSTLETDPITLSYTWIRIILCSSSKFCKRKI